jgi:hypothetical protein
MCNFYTLASNERRSVRVRYVYTKPSKKLVYLEMEEKGEIFDCGELLLELFRELADILQACENRPPGIHQEHLHLNFVFRGAGHLLQGLVISSAGPCRQREVFQNWNPE